MTSYTHSDDQFIEIVKSSFSIREVLRKLDHALHGGSYRSFKLRVKKLNIDTSHFTGQGHLKGKRHNWSKKIDLSDILVANSNRVLTTRIKQRIIADHLLKNECNKCGLQNYWQDGPLVLHLDHIDGDHFNHQITNLRLLCPNCHSQTPTYCSKNKKRYK